MNILIISGSARPKRQSHHVAVAIQQKLEGKPEHNIQLIDVREHPLPLLEYVFQSHPSPSDMMKKWKEAVDKADVYIVVSPEHNAGFAGALKNAMDHFYDEYGDKPLAIATASSGVLGGINAAKALQLYGIKLRTIVMPDFLITPKVQTLFDTDSKIIDEGYEKRLDKFVDSFLQFAAKHKK